MEANVIENIARGGEGRTLSTAFYSAMTAAIKASKGDAAATAFVEVSVSRCVSPCCSVSFGLQRLDADFKKGRQQGAPNPTMLNCKSIFISDNNLFLNHCVIVTTTDLWNHVDIGLKSTYDRNASALGGTLRFFLCGFFHPKHVLLL